MIGVCGDVVSRMRRHFTVAAFLIGLALGATPSACSYAQDRMRETYITKRQLEVVPSNDGGCSFSGAGGLTPGTPVVVKRHGPFVYVEARFVFFARDLSKLGLEKLGDGSRGEFDRMWNCQ